MNASVTFGGKMQLLFRAPESGQFGRAPILHCFATELPTINMNVLIILHVPNRAQFIHVHPFQRRIREPIFPN